MTVFSEKAFYFIGKLFTINISFSWEKPGNCTFATFDNSITNREKENDFYFDRFVVDKWPDVVQNISYGEWWFIYKLSYIHCK